MIQIEPGTIGGVLLIAGAFVLYQGKLMQSVGLYFFADLMWVWLAYKQDDIFGVICISIGMLLGVGVFLKSHSGEFVQTLKKEKDRHE